MGFFFTFVFTLCNKNDIFSQSISYSKGPGNKVENVVRYEICSN